MVRSIRRLALLCLAFSVAGAATAQRPYGVDDMLALESFGRARFDPTGNYLVFERQGRFDQQASYGRQYVFGETRSRIHVADIRSTAAPTLLFDQDEHAGYIFGSFAPDGLSVLVSRVSDDGFETGISRLANGRFRPFPINPAYDLTGQTPWSGQQLIMAAVPDGELDLRITIATERVEEIAQLWRARNRGDVATSRRVGSGRFATLPERRGGLVRIDMSDGSVEALANGRFASWHLAADGNALAALREERLALAPGQLMEHGANAGGISRRLLLLDPRHPGSPAIEICASCDILAGSVSWSPSGQALAFYARDEGMSWSTGRFHIYDRNDGILHDIELGGLRPHDERERVQIRMSSAWIGDHLAILAAVSSSAGGDQGQSRADWYLIDGQELRNLTAGFAGPTPELIAPARDGLVLLHDGDAWLVDGSGNHLNLTSHIPQRVRAWREPTGYGPAAAENSRPTDIIALEALRPGTTRAQQVLLVELASGLIRSIPVPSEDSQVIAVSPNEGRAAVLERENNVTTLRVIGADGSNIELARINEHLRDVIEGRAVRIDHQGPSGDARISWLLLPPGHQPGRPAPTVVNLYPGNVGRETWQRWRLDMVNPMNDQILAAQGYAILYPTLPVRYEQVPREPLEGLADEVSVAVDAAIASGLVDPERIAVQGQSYGGYATAGLIAQTDRFRTAVATAGIYDLVSSYGAFDVRMRLEIENNGIGMFGVSHLETSQGGMGAPPWADPQRYLRNSPLMHVENINTPLMLVTSDMDFVSTTQSEEMFTALTRLNRDAEFVRYFGEDHILNSPANIRDFWRRILNWYELTLVAP